MEKLKKIRLRSKEERRFRAGHPWVFSNELQESPKSLGLGEVVELQDSGGAFLAFGFANPGSLITFRELSREREGWQFQPFSVDPGFFKEKIRQARAFRSSWFSPDQSHRMVYGEADGLSGLIIDRFFGESSVVDVIQPHSAGMDFHLDSILKALRDSGTQGKAHFAIIRRDASSREREGLEKLPSRIVDLIHGAEGVDPTPFRNFRFRVSGIMGSSLMLSADLIAGQKTGFFFDQLQNIRLLETLLLRKIRNEGKRFTDQQPFRILDLCSYVGQWSVHLMQTLSERQALPAEFTCIDASNSALEFAKVNLEFASKSFGITDRVRINMFKGDVLEPLTGVGERAFDVVVADPPAFIKNRKSIPQGKQAYIKLFQAAIEKTISGGLVVCCSCSQLLSEEDFLEVLAKSARKSGRRVRWLARGSPSFDHATPSSFQEGLYLKSAIGQVDET